LTSMNYTIRRSKPYSWVNVNVDWLL